MSVVELSKGFTQVIRNPNDIEEFLFQQNGVTMKKLRLTPFERKMELYNNYHLTNEGYNYFLINNETVVPANGIECLVGAFKFYNAPSSGTTCKIQLCIAVNHSEGGWGTYNMIVRLKTKLASDPNSVVSVSVTGSAFDAVVPSTELYQPPYNLYLPSGTWSHNSTYSDTYSVYLVAQSKNAGSDILFRNISFDVWY